MANGMAENNVTSEQPVEAEQPEKLKWGPFSALGVSFLTYLLAQLILFIPFALITIFTHGQDAQSTLNNNAWLELSLTGISSLTMIGVLWLFLRGRRSGFKELGFKTIRLADAGWVIVGLVVYYVLLIAALAVVGQLIPGFNVTQPQEIGYSSANGWQLVLAFIGLAVLPPIAEETLFRGFMYRGLASRWPKWVAAFLASGLFALVHFQWNVGIDVFILSMVMIVIYEKTKNLWACVALHAVKNTIAFLLLFVFTN